MQHYIDIEEIEIDPGTEFLASSYPGPGVYYMPNIGHMAFTDGAIVYTVPEHLFRSKLNGGAKERGREDVVDAGTLLKAIAVMQRPELAFASSVK
jgi:hypothetical protein